MTKEILLTQNKISLLDDEDYNLISDKLWFIKENGNCYYATTDDRTMLNGVRGGKTISMHSIIMRCPKDFVVDHINGNGLDNRKKNLRIITAKENSARILRRRGKIKNYRGVKYDLDRNKWHASINNSGKVMFIGRYNTEVEAALAYDRQSLIMNGDNAILNFKQPSIAAPVIAFHGLQGSSKTTLLNFLNERLIQYGYQTATQNVKSTFTNVAEDTLHLWEKMLEDIGRRDLIEKVKTTEFKKLWYLNTSTFGESLDQNIWSDAFYNIIKYSITHTILVDDIRTAMNIEALTKLSAYRNVHLFALHAPEDIRKERVSTWRNNGGYTEQMQTKPENLPNNFKWYDIDTSKPLVESQKYIIDKLFDIKEMINTNNSMFYKG